MMMRTVLIALILFAAPLLSTGGYAQTRVNNAPDPYLHKGTSFRFPTQVGPFKRTSVTEYSADGRDAGAGYELVVDGRSMAVVTVYVYPSDPDFGTTGDARCATAFADGKASIAQRFVDARSTDEGERPAPDANAGIVGRYAAMF